MLGFPADLSGAFPPWSSHRLDSPVRTNHPAIIENWSLFAYSSSWNYHATIMSQQPVSLQSLRIVATVSMKCHFSLGHFLDRKHGITLSKRNHIIDYFVIVIDTINKFINLQYFCMFALLLIGSWSKKSNLYHHL